jgi:predicted TPR repeat methyltransferase
LTAGYHDPLKCAELTKEIFGDEAPNVHILDLGCGTGLVGQYLKERGFLHVDGIDASAGMLERAREKGAYESLTELFLGKPDTYPEQFRGKYEAITAAGILAEGHLDNNVFEEFLLSLKDNGYAIFATRTMYLEKYSYGEKIKELEETKRWKLIKEITFDRYDQMEEAVGRFSKVEIKGFVYQKL